MTARTKLSPDGIERSTRESQSVEWYTEGQTRAVYIDGVQITIRFVGRKGRRARIAVKAPAGAVFRSLEPRECEDAIHRDP
jgi:hypothetical protein